MADLSLNATVRTQTGSRPAGRMRAAGQLPAVLYGKGTEPVLLTLDHRETRHALQDHENRKKELMLTVDGKVHRVKVQEIQLHPVRNTAAHIDFVLV